MRSAPDEAGNPAEGTDLIDEGITTSLNTLWLRIGSQSEGTDLIDEGITTRGGRGRHPGAWPGRN